MTDTRVLVWPAEDGTVNCTTPAPGYSCEHIANMVIPTGRPYLIVERADLPPDDGFWFGAWEADYSNPDGVSEDFDWAAVDNELKPDLL